MNNKKTSKPIDILLVEDNASDIKLTKEALSQANVNNTLNVVTDGEMALDYLYKRGKYTDVTEPDIILLDLNLPKIDGREVLKTIKSDPERQHIPIVILTTSSSDADIMDSYTFHANCYITKPVGFKKFVTTVKLIEAFWFDLAKLPNFSKTYIL